MAGMKVWIGILWLLVLGNCAKPLEGGSNSEMPEGEKNMATESPIESLPSETLNAVGVLVLKDSYRQNDTVKFYNEDGSLWYKFTYYYDDSDGKFDFPNADFQPLAFHPDYFLLALKTVEEGDDDYTVIVNEHTGLTKRIRKEDFLQLLTWEQYILSSFSVGFDVDQNPIRKQPDISSETIPKAMDVNYLPVKIQGEWLQIKWGKENEMNFGWIRWIEKNTLIIEVFAFA